MKLYNVNYGHLEPGTITSETQRSLKSDFMFLGKVFSLGTTGSSLTTHVCEDWARIGRN